MAKNDFVAEAEVWNHCASLSCVSYYHIPNVNYISVAFPVDIDRKRALPAHGSWQRLHAG